MYEHHAPCRGRIRCSAAETGLTNGPQRSARSQNVHDDELATGDQEIRRIR